MAFVSVNDVHELSADGFAVGSLQCVVDFSQSGICFAYMQAARLKNSLIVGLR